MKLWVSITSENQANLCPCHKAPAESPISAIKTKTQIVPDHALKRGMKCTDRKENFFFFPVILVVCCFFFFMQNLLLSCYFSVFCHIYQNGSIFAFFSHYSKHHTSDDSKKKPQFIEGESQPLKHLKPLQKLISSLPRKVCH